MLLGRHEQDSIGSLHGFQHVVVRFLRDVACTRDRHRDHPLRADLFFFFSSRRRHTRCLSDWSSDVCSSDLIAALLRRPWVAYDALIRANQFHVIDKLMFGSDFPFTTAGECIETLYSINQMAMGTNMPTVPRESLRDRKSVV